MNLHEFDLIIINSSGGKDSLCALYEVCRIASIQNYPKSNMIISHQDLGKSEWPGLDKLLQDQSNLFGLDLIISKRIDKKGYAESFLEYALRREKWPSNKQRWCTSDFKRGPGEKVARRLSKNLETSKILYVFGFRKDESPSRSKKDPLKINKNLTTKKRLVYDYLPIHKWSTDQVWRTIRQNNLPYHPAYDLGMPRLSCVFCIFSPLEALIISGIANPDLLDEYIEVEDKIGHTFRKDLSLRQVKMAILNNEIPQKVNDWQM